MDAGHLEAALGALRNPLAYLLPIRAADGRATDFLLTWANPTYVSRFAPGDDSVGRPVSQVMPAPWRAQLMPAYLDAFADQRQHNIELTFDIAGRTFDFMFLLMPTEAGLAISVEDRTARKRAEAELARNAELLSGIARLQARFLADEPIAIVAASVLLLAMETTSSTHGFIGEVRDRDGTRVLHIHAMNDRSWDDATPIRQRETQDSGVHVRPLDPVWEHLLRTAEPIVSNEPGTEPDLRLVTRWQIEREVSTLIAIPFRHGDALLGILVLANRRDGYEHEWVKRLEPLIGAAGGMLDASNQAAARRRVERELRRSEELLREAQEIAALGAYSYELPDGNGRWTEQTYRLLSVPLDKPPLTLRQVLDSTTDDDRQMLRELYENVAQDGLQRQVDVSLPIEGAARHLQIVMRGRRAADGAVLELHGTIKDITERKRVEDARIRFEQQLAETQRLESLGLLAGGIAHDVNNLLVGVLANASLIIDELPPDDVHAEAAVEIETAARRMAELTRQILDYAGRSRVAPQPLDVNPLISETVHLVRRSMPRNAKLELALSNEPMIVEADAAQLRQVVMNLVINAGEALSGSPGEVRVETRSVPGDDGRSSASIVVSDTGVGMNEEVRRRIFDPFFTTKEKGRGLGLSAVHGIVRRLGGCIGVTSRPLRGTTFHVSLPITEQLAAPLRGSPVVPVRARRLRVLVVDDEAIVRSAVQRMLERVDCEVVIADGGREALHQFAAMQQRFDVVLLDVLMPYLSGADVLREIRRIAPDQRVVMMSGFVGRDENATKSADGFLRKPFTREELETMLASLETLTSK